MKAMILAAGMGTRLAHITQKTPKCLVDVAGKPMIWYVIRSLRQAGVSEVVVNLHYMAEEVHDYLETLQSDELKIHYSREESLLDTGGGLRFAARLLGSSEPVLIHNADIYTEIPLTSIEKAHESSDALVTLCTRVTDDPRTLLFSEEGQLLGWRNSSTGDERVVVSSSSMKSLGFCGISLISPRFFQYLDDFGEKFSLISPFLKASELGERVQSFEDNQSFWVDMGTPEKLDILRKRLGDR